MTHHLRTYEADPFDVQIGAMVIFHRAALSTRDSATHDQLKEVSSDHLWYGQMLARERRADAPWDCTSKNEVGPAEVFLEALDVIGYTQSIPRPSLGMDHRHFRLMSRSEGEQGGFAPNPALAKARAVIELVQHPDRRWQVLHCEVRASFRRQGIATTLYNAAERFLVTRLSPSGWLTDDAYAFWKARGCAFLHAYQQMDHVSGFWVSPKALLTLREIARARLAQAASEYERPN